MSRKRNRNDASARFVALYHYVMRTEAWRDLDCVARCTYIELARRYAGPGSNNGRLSCSLREIAEALGISKATAMRALDSLQFHGFIVMMKKGAFSMKIRHASEWRLTEFRCDVTGEPPTKEFARWKKQNTISPAHPIGFPNETERVST